MNKSKSSKFSKFDRDLFYRHLKDGMIRTCVTLLRAQGDFKTEEYCKMYLSLCSMIIRLQQNVGSLNSQVYLDFIQLREPLVSAFSKGGVDNE